MFNKKVGKIIFILFFLNPIFFGHFAINPKDTIVAFANIWSTYILLKYLQKQNQSNNCNRYILLAGLAIGLGTGVRLAFIVTLIPLFLFSIFDILFLKIITNKKFSFKKFIIDLIKVFVIAYLITISFWPHVHGNILTEPFKLFLLMIERLSYQEIIGLPWMLFNGNIVETNPPPNSYLIINFFYKSPEFILLGYIFFIFLLAINRNFFLSQFEFFWTKILLILFIFLSPIIYFTFSPYVFYDGLRLVLYLIPYFCIIPGLAIYYLISNLSNLLPKFLLGIVGSMFIYYLYIFILLTPYQYTYLNIFIGDISNAHKKFENDYWGASIKELIKKIPSKTNLINNNEKIKITFCGLPHQIAKRELKKLKNLKFEEQFLYAEDFDYVIMTNRLVGIRRDNYSRADMKTCFEKFTGKDLISIKRNGLMLSTLRKKL